MCVWVHKPAHNIQTAMKVFIFFHILNDAKTHNHNYHKVRINQHDHAIKTYQPVRTDGQIRAAIVVRSKLPFCLPLVY